MHPERRGDRSRFGGDERRRIHRQEDRSEKSDANDDNNDARTKSKASSSRSTTRRTSSWSCSTSSAPRATSRWAIPWCHADQSRNSRSMRTGSTCRALYKAAFESATDTSQLMPGQDVQIQQHQRQHPMGSPITMTTNRVRLRETQFTANVSGAPVPPNFTVSNLPGLFTSMGVNFDSGADVEPDELSGMAGWAGFSRSRIRVRCRCAGCCSRTGRIRRRSSSTKSGSDSKKEVSSTIA